MKVLFVYPNRDCQIGFNYGLAFLSAVLKEAGHETRLLNLNEKLATLPTLEEIGRAVRDYAPDLVGMSVVTNQWRYALEVAQAVRKVTDAPLVCGGIHATMSAEEILEGTPFDYAVVGEGEGAILDLVRAIDRNADVSRISNLACRIDGKVQVNAVRPLVNLSTLPRKDYGLFDFQRMIDAKDGWVGIMAGRGCPFRCTYCFNHAIVERYSRDTGLSPAALHYVRWHPVEEVIEEILWLQKTYRRIRMIIFDDDLFTLDREYLAEFTKQYRARVRLPFVANAHVKHFDRDIARMFKDAGCAIVKFGVESGSDRIRRDIMHRRMSNGEIERAFEAAHEAGLHTSAFVMLGLPHEGREEIEETVRLLGRIGPGRFRWAIFFPFPGTRAFEIAREGGFIDEAKLPTLSNFFEDSALDFGPEHNLFIRKLRRALPWYVNAACDREGADYYHKLVRLVERWDESAWERLSPRMIEFDRNVSAHAERKGWRHYLVRFNDFMAVDSAWKE
ncbi:MAG: radical SAM protein [Planctomycetota bacterium]